MSVNIGASSYLRERERLAQIRRDRQTDRRHLDKVSFFFGMWTGGRVPNRDLSTSDKTVTNGKSGCEGGRREKG